LPSEKHILVYIARHGTTDLNKSDSYRGPIDAPLDKSGWRDANALAFYFEPVEICAIVHSDRKRTRATADLIAERKGVEAETNPNLRAWDVGDLGGKPKSKENEELVDWHVAHPSIPLPGGESLDEFKARVQPLIRDAIKLGAHAFAPLLIVAHSSVIHEVGTMIGGSHEYTLVEPGGVAAIYVQSGKLDAEPVFKARPRSKGAEIT
jgi:probable phosphoglycerate mutase